MTFSVFSWQVKVYVEDVSKKLPQAYPLLVPTKDML
jgi:hypothetical protein